MSGHEFFELRLNLRVSQADRRSVAAVDGVRICIGQGAAEMGVVDGEVAQRVVVLGRDRIDVFVPAAVVGQVFEKSVQPRPVIGGIRRGSFRVPVHRVVGVGRHHRAAVVVQIREEFVERLAGARAGADTAARVWGGLKAYAFAVLETDQPRRRRRRARHEREQNDRRHDGRSHRPRRIDQPRASAPRRAAIGPYRQRALKPRRRRGRRFWCAAPSHDVPIVGRRRLDSAACSQVNA